MQETRRHGGRAADFCGVTEDDVVGAEQLGEIVRGEADASLRQVEAELVPHRPAQPRIDPRRRRPYAFDQPAQNDPVGLRQPRFQLAVDVKLRPRRFRPPYDAVAECGLEYLRVVAEFDHQAAWRLPAEQIVECGGQRRPLRPFKCHRDVMRVARQFQQNVAMAFGQFGKIKEFRGAQAFERSKCFPQQLDQLTGSVELLVAEPGPGLGVVQ